MALLTLSLNAQKSVTTKAEDKQMSFTEKTVTTSPAKAPNRAEPSSGTLLVADGTTTSSQIPVYGLYQDYGYRTQVIYTADMLDDGDLEVGDKITSLTFYPSDGIKFAASTVTFQLCHTTTGYFGTSSSSNQSRISITGDVATATVTPTTNSSATTWTITFDSPLTYNGGNLLLDVYCYGYNHDSTTGGACVSTSFYGVNQTNYQSLYITGTRTQTPAATETGTTRQFLPKTTFAFEKPDPGTICDGTTTNKFLPIYGYWYDNKQINQMIYPSELLADLNGKKLTSMTFYSPHIYFYNGAVTFKLATTTQASFTTVKRLTASDIRESDFTIVKQGFAAPNPAGGTTLTIPFDDSDFTYNGGNLVIDVEVTTAGVYGGSQTYFYGKESTGGGFYSRGSQTNTNGVYTDDNAICNFLPKVTFTYEDAHDLAISLSAPSQSAAGKPVEVTATVTNNGSFTEQGYTVTFTDGTTTIPQTADASQTLEAGASTTFTVEFPTSDTDAGQRINFTATVTCADDAVATNNTATASTALVEVPAPENVVATPDDNQNATMTWDAPNSSSAFPLAPSTITEGFEDTSVFPAFSLGGITATQHTGAIGNWTLYDSTGSRVYGYQNVTVPYLGNPMAWMVFAPGSDQLSQSLTDTQAAHNGDQMMASYCTVDASSGVHTTTDHWLISPELSGNAQTISFYARELTDDYGAETFEVLYSTTDNNPASFVQAASLSSRVETWGVFTAELPAGAKYFAIRHTSIDIFALFVDDITFETLVPAPPVSYNVYLDGELVGNVNSNVFSYNFTNVSAGEHECAVSALYYGGLESEAVPATFFIKITPNAPTVTPATGDADVTITITPDPATDGTLVYSYVDQNGNEIQGATNPMTFPRGESDYVVTVHAYTTATTTYKQSEKAVVPVTIPALPATAVPTISVTATTDTEVTITATGTGTVSLTVNGQTVTGDGSVSITVPRGMEDHTVTATATAKETNHPTSAATTQDVLIPGRAAEGGWREMKGDFTGTDQLSFIDKLTDDFILFIDQYSGDTELNQHAGSYEYVLEEVGDNPRSSTKATIEIPKTGSTLTGLFTENEVKGDYPENGYEAWQQRANNVNGTMTYDVMMRDGLTFYGLYRSDAGDEYPLLNDAHLISKLMQISEDGQERYITELLLDKNVEPVYDQIGSGNVTRWDKAYLQGEPLGTATYVPVIWISGISTGRKDFKDNSYGSDIKQVVLGDVEPTIEVVNSAKTSWGKWKYNGQEYCIYSPVIELKGVLPEDEAAKDGDSYTYNAYMYRVWCTYAGARTYARDANGNLTDGGSAKTTPFLIGEVSFNDNEDGLHTTIGSQLSSPQDAAALPWTFAAPVGLSANDLTFVVRFYYKKTVTNAPARSRINANRDGEGDGEYYIVEENATAKDITTSINELAGLREVASVTYVNALGQQSSRPFDGVNIVVTRYTDGTTSTVKVVR